jgi:hypothetical protein
VDETTQVDFCSDREDRVDLSKTEQVSKD